MQPIQLVLGVHLHQPVGNFGWVLEEAHQQSYAPFLEVFRDFPSLKLVWHCTGFLLEWMMEHHPEYLERLDELVQQGRVEIFTGGMYEPIFPIIPPEDRLEQIRRLSRLVEDRFRIRPRGAWLAERVWEPAIAADLSRAGVDYVALDDYHFFASGMAEAAVDGYFTVEELDRNVAVFPISERMRYLIPWMKPAEVLDALRRMQAEGRTLAVMMDDGEKFGAWPETYEWVYTQGWLREFFTLLEANPDVVRTTTFADFYRLHPPAGRAALPVASYVEMGQWALWPAGAVQYEEWKTRFEKEQVFDRVKPFFRGGIWRNFLVRYSEANYLHKRILHLSREFEAAGAREHPAYNHLLQAQCNDVFWHGVFGGLYFPHLRHEAYRHLLTAQTGLESLRGDSWPAGVTVTRRDLDLDHQPEIILNSRDWFAVVDPADGGTLQELSWKPRAVNLLATLTRRREKYHLVARNQRTVLLGDADPEASTEQAALVFDEVPRTSSREKLYTSLPPLLQLAANQDRPALSFWEEPFRDNHPTGAGPVVELEAARDGLKLVKRYLPLSEETGLGIEYQLTGQAMPVGWLAVEWTLGIAGAEDSRIRCLPEGDDTRATGIDAAVQLEDLHRLLIENRREGYSVDFRPSVAVSARLWPIETVSLAIDRQERTGQGVAVALFFPLDERQPAGFRLEVILGSL